MNKGDARIPTEEARLALEIKATRRTMFGWGGIFVAALAELALFWRVNPLPPAKDFFAVYVLLASPFAALDLVGEWGEAWLRPSSKRSGGRIERIGAMCVFEPAKTTAVLTVGCLILGLLVVSFIP